MDARIRLVGPTGTRDLRMRELYQFDGMDHLKIEDGELLTQIRVPCLAEGTRSTYRKLRRRDSIDFPQLGIAIVIALSGTTVDSLDIVVGAVNPQPKPIRKLDGFVGSDLTDDAVNAIGALVEKQTRPQRSIVGEPDWRRRMAGHFTRSALKDLRDN